MRSWIQLAENTDGWNGRDTGGTRRVDVCGCFEITWDARSKLRIGMLGGLTEASVRPDPEGRGRACVGATNPAERTSDQATGMIMRSAATSTIR